MENYQDINAKTIDRWVDEGWQWGKPVSHEEYVKALNGEWEVLLTPTVYVPKEWFGENGEIRGKRILGLASGGGQQMPVFAAAGAVCTVLDYSSRQISAEKMVAEREGYAIDIVQADMTKPLPFEDESFDIIFYPVSNCYIEDVYSVFKECARVLKKGGTMLGGFDTEINYMVSSDETRIVNKMPFNPLINPEQMRELEEDDAGIQFSHTVVDQIGGQLKAGLTLVDLYDDTNGEGRLHELNVKTFIATKTVKRL